METSRVQFPPPTIELSKKKKFKIYIYKIEAYSRGGPASAGECKCNQGFRPLQSKYTACFHLIIFCSFCTCLLKNEKEGNSIRHEKLLLGMVMAPRKSNLFRQKKKVSRSLYNYLQISSDKAISR